ncbi:MAG: hypothetical protein IT563_00890 [Alphaproteobacteria bacterium]|nr:hypothetical protein [Alphaproteobacteria bacterium]
MILHRLLARRPFAAAMLAPAALVAALALPALAQQPPVLAPANRYEIRTDVYFYDTDILRDAYAREPYKTTIMVDRQTGQTWVLMKVGESRVVWSAVEFRNADGKLVARPQ